MACQSSKKGPARSSSGWWSSSRARFRRRAPAHKTPPTRVLYSPASSVQPHCACQVTSRAQRTWCGCYAMQISSSSSSGFDVSTAAACLRASSVISVLLPHPRPIAPAKLLTSCPYGFARICAHACGTSVGSLLIWRGTRGVSRFFGAYLCLLLFVHPGAPINNNVRQLLAHRQAVPVGPRLPRLGQLKLDAARADHPPGAERRIARRARLCMECAKPRTCTPWI